MEGESIGFFGVGMVVLVKCGQNGRISVKWGRENGAITGIGRRENGEVGKGWGVWGRLKIPVKMRSNSHD